MQLSSLADKLSSKTESVFLLIGFIQKLISVAASFATGHPAGSTRLGRATSGVASDAAFDHYAEISSLNYHLNVTIDHQSVVSRAGNERGSWGHTLYRGGEPWHFDSVPSTSATSTAPIT